VSGCTFSVVWTQFPEHRLGTTALEAELQHPISRLGQLPPRDCNCITCSPFSAPMRRSCTASLMLEQICTTMHVAGSSPSVSFQPTPSSSTIIAESSLTIAIKAVSSVGILQLLGSSRVLFKRGGGLNDTAWVSSRTKLTASMP